MCRELVRATVTELLKCRRSPVAWLTVLVPVLSALGTYLACYSNRAFARPEFWGGYVGNAIVIWAILFLPLTAALVTSQLAEVERRDHMWKQLFLLPLLRRYHVLAKMIVALLAVAAATALLVAFTWIGGTLLSRLATSPLDDFPVRMILFAAVRVWLASWCLTALSLWASLRSSSSATPIIVGILGVFSLLLAGKGVDEFIPWRWPTQVMESSSGLLPLILGVSMGVVVALAMSKDFCSRDVLD